MEVQDGRGVGVKQGGGIASDLSQKVSSGSQKDGREGETGGGKEAGHGPPRAASGQDQGGDSRTGRSGLVP